ncbi:aminotransferase class IV [Chitinophaga pendula]|uniref:aminotransferase class IV n=1 Tax=Chitinophaga TaxID=79328 RepID=UPI000BAE778C|nr:MULTISPECIES: aminotransferase class IV [Chitinophaga]ASZ10193.1 amino acid aminotransferase [Chitinophaga sp. MD30]UCJ06851.1 aminotransferase class IV [Chitinophaga pendula]
MNANYTWINGEWVLQDQASLYISDLSIQRGYGIFDFLKMTDGKALFFDDHLDRFFHSASIMHLPVAFSRQELKAVISEMTERNHLSDAGIRLTLTGGYAPDAYTPATPNLIITQQPLSIPPLSQGIAIITHAHQRQLPTVKTIDYLMAIWLQPLVAKSQAQDVLYHQQGIVTECPRANFYIVTAAGEIWTPAENVLAGVIRKQLLQLDGQGFNIKATTFTLEDVKQAKEAFITSTTKNILPILQIDGVPVGNGTPGSVTQRLSEVLRELSNNHN